MEVSDFEVDFLEIVKFSDNYHFFNAIFFQKIIITFKFLLLLEQWKNLLGENQQLGRTFRGNFEMNHLIVNWAEQSF